MKNRELQALLARFDGDVNVRIEARANVPGDLEDASEADQMIDDGELLDITDDRSVYVAVGELIVIGDKRWED